MLIGEFGSLGKVIGDLCHAANDNGDLKGPYTLGFYRSVRFIVFKKLNVRS